MSFVSSLVVVPCALLSLSGCTLLIPGVGGHDIQRDATKQEHARCGPEAPDPRLYSAALVESAEPFYQHVMGGPNDLEARLEGAVLELRPLSGVTAELLARELMCRSAQLTLAHAQPVPNEPYFLPDGWVTIDVRSDHGSFVVRLIAEDAEHGREILARARAFAASSASSSPSPLAR